MEHESASNWLDAHLDGDGRWADADTAVLVAADDLTSAVADDAGVVDAAPPGEGGAWLDQAGTLPGLETDGVEQVLITDADLADAGVPVDADLAVPEPADTPSESGIVDPFDDFLARTSDDAAIEPAEATADPAAIGDDVAPAPTDADPEQDDETPPSPVDAVPAPEPADPAPMAGYDAFDQLDEPAAGDDWSVDLTPDQPLDPADDHHDPADVHDGELDGGDLA